MNDFLLKYLIPMYLELSEVLKNEKKTFLIRFFLTFLFFSSISIAFYFLNILEISVFNKVFDLPFVASLLLGLSELIAEYKFYKNEKQAVKQNFDFRCFLDYLILSDDLGRVVGLLSDCSSYYFNYETDSVSRYIENRKKELILMGVKKENFEEIMNEEEQEVTTISKDKKKQKAVRDIDDLYCRLRYHCKNEVVNKQKD